MLGGVMHTTPCETIKIRTRRHTSCRRVPELVFPADVLGMEHHTPSPVDNNKRIVGIALVLHQPAYHKTVVETVTIGRHYIWKLQ